jgi:hypothetical protein
MKVNIELNIPDDRIFLNFWNWYNGDDVVCEIKNGKLYQNDIEISLEDFCQMVKTRVEEIQKK